MASSGVNTGFAKCFIVFMAVVILLQGCLYLGLSIWGITFENCSKEATDVSAKPFQFAMDLIYFRSESCGEPNISVAGVNGDIPIDIDWSKSFVITNRMNIFLITYAVISALWIVSSLLVFATICGPITTTVSAICFWPWFLFVIAGSILDVVATGYHIHDILHTESAAETFKYVGASSTSTALMTFLEGFDPYFIIPAVVLTCVSCRVILIWLLNIFGSIFCISLSQTLANQNSNKNKHAQESRTIAAARGDDNRVNNSAQPPLQSQTQIKLRNADIYSEQIQPKPLPIQTAEPLQTHQTANRPYESLQLTIDNYPPSAPMAMDNASRQNNSNEFYRQPSEVNEIITYRNTDTHPDRLDYPSVKNRESRPISPLSTASALNNRYSTAEMSSPSNTPSQNQPQRVSAELRSQLPWSYTNVAAKPQPPRKPQMKVYPEIPEPDYTNRRPTNNESRNSNLQPAEESYSRW